MTMIITTAIAAVALLLTSCEKSVTVTVLPVYLLMFCLLQAHHHRDWCLLFLLFVLNNFCRVDHAACSGMTCLLENFAMSS